MPPIASGETDLLLYLVLLLFLGAVHAGLLWSGYFAARLRLALLALELELAEVESTASPNDRTPIRLFRERLSVARRQAALIGWMRCLVAVLLVKDEAGLSSRRILMTVGSAEHRELTLGIHRRFEDAILRHIAVLPLFQVLRRRPEPDPRGGPAGVSVIDRLIATLPPYSTQRH